MQTADLLIKTGYILTMNDANPELKNQHIAIKDGKIAAILPAGESTWDTSEYLDATGCITTPGLINGHSHLPMTYFRGLADDLPLNTWLQEYIWPMEAKILNNSVIYNAALHGAAEMLKNGITMTHDMYFDISAIADACSEIGLRALIGEAGLDFKIAAGWDPGAQTAELKARYKDNPLVDFNLSPHSIYTCSRATLERYLQAAEELDVYIHLHLSETEAEVQNCIRDNGMRPVFYLKEIGMLQRPLLLAHGIWVDESEMELLAGKEVSIASCTDSNLKLASGILPLKSYLDKGINVCLGTDGVASNNDLDLLSELGTTARLQKAINRDPSFLSAKEALKMITINAARALGVEHLRGSIEVGKDADLCIFATDDLQAQPLYHPESHLVYAMSSKHVRHTIVAGKIVVRDGRLTQADEGQIIAKAREYGQKIRRELGK